MSKQENNNWIADHKLLTAAGIVVALSILGAALGSGPAPSASNSAKPVATATPTPTPKFDMVAFYAGIENGQTKAQVTAAAGKDASSCSETEIAGYGKTEYCMWDGGFSGTTVSVSFTNNAVSSKTKFGF